MTQPGYFELRGLHPEESSLYKMPAYLRDVIEKNKIKNMLDIGCGTGHFLAEIKKTYGIEGKGVDTSPEAIACARTKGVDVELIEDISGFSKNHDRSYDLITMIHVLEHLKKNQMIGTLKDIRKNLLSVGGKLFVAVPNAQSSTGCYWAYEDFQHNWLFTTGSLYYVLLAAGFTSVDFVDPFCTSGMGGTKKILRLALLKLYEMRIRIWNIAADGAFHKPSPNIFSYEIKCLAK